MTTPLSGEPTTRQLALFRIVGLAGVLIFGAVIWFLHRQAGYVPDPRMEELRPVIPAIMLAMIGAVVAIRIYLSRITDARHVGKFQLIGWAVGEAAAILGAVYYFNTDDPRFYIMGLFVMAASFIVLPLRRA